MKTGSLLAIVLFVLIALAHLIRVLFGLEVLVGGVNVPIGVSIVGFVVAAGAAYLLWKEAQ